MKARKYEFNENEEAVNNELEDMMYYSARACQSDVDRLTEPGLYILDGDTHMGYIMKHCNGNVIARNLSPRALAVVTISLYRNSVPEPRLTYTEACEALLQQTYGIGIGDTSPPDGEDTPEEYVARVGRKYGLTARKDWTAEKAGRVLARFGRDINAEPEGMAAVILEQVNGELAMERLLAEAQRPDPEPSRPVLPECYFCGKKAAYILTDEDGYPADPTDCTAVLACEACAKEPIE